MLLRGIDTTDSVQGHAHALKAAGVDFVIKYCENTKTFPRKAMTGLEVQGLHSVGIQVGCVFESGNILDCFTPQDGVLDAQIASAHLLSIGAPSDGFMAFAVDFDPTEAQVNSIIVPYFEAVRSVMRPGFLVDAYGSGLTLSILKNLGLIHRTWLAQSTGWAGYREFLPLTDLVQNLNTPPLGLAADWNTCTSLPGCW